MDGAVDGFEELPEDGGRGVTEDGPGPAGENRRHEAGTVARSVVADGVDAAVNSKEPATLNPPRHRPSTQTRFFKLPKRDDAVLPSGDLGHPGVEHVEFVTHEVTKATGARTLPLTCCFFTLVRRKGDREVR